MIETEDLCLRVASALARAEAAAGAHGLFLEPIAARTAPAAMVPT